MHRWPPDSPALPPRCGLLQSSSRPAMNATHSCGTTQVHEGRADECAWVVRRLVPRAGLQHRRPELFERVGPGDTLTANAGWSTGRASTGRTAAGGAADSWSRRSSLRRPSIGDADRLYSSDPSTTRAPSASGPVPFARGANALRVSSGSRRKYFCAMGEMALLESHFAVDSQQLGTGW